MKLNLRKTVKIFGVSIPLMYIILSMVAMGAIIGVVFINSYAIESQGTIRSPTALLVEDGDTSDAITFSLSGQNVVMTMPIYAQNGVIYNKTIKATARENGILRAVHQRTVVGATSVWIQDNGGSWISMTTSPTTTDLKTMAINDTYYINFKIDAASASVGAPDKFTDREVILCLFKRVFKF